MFSEKESSCLTSLLLQGGTSSNNISNIMTGLHFGELEAIFLSFQTNGSFNKYIKKHFGYIEPNEHVLATDSKVKCCSFQYISILKSLEMLFKHPDILAEVMQGHTSRDGKLRDYCGGSLYKNNKLFSSETPTLQIQL